MGFGKGNSGSINACKEANIKDVVEYNHRAKVLEERTLPENWVSTQLLAHSQAAARLANFRKHQESEDPGSDEDSEDTSSVEESEEEKEMPHITITFSTNNPN
jgi:hypothetical protein